MKFVPADSFSLAAFCVLVVIVWAQVLYALWMASKGSLVPLLFILYVGLFGGIVIAGLPAQMPIPVVPILFLSVLVVACAIALTDLGAGIAERFSLIALVGFQAFRFPLELILHQWAKLGTVPETMTWTGQNWDVVSGLVALLAAPFVARLRALAWVTQIVGFVLLLNVLRVVIMSSPLPFAWPLENPLALIAYMPYALIGPLCVGAAFAAHLITLRKLVGGAGLEPAVGPL